MLDGLVTAEVDNVVINVKKNEVINEDSGKKFKNSIYSTINFSVFFMPEAVTVIK